MIWKPGDRAILDTSTKPTRFVHLGRYCGSIVTLVEYIGDTTRKHKGHDIYIFNSWHVAADDGEHLLVNENRLIPIDDHNQKSSWSECVWRPKGVEV